MKRRFKTAFTLVKETISRWSDHRASRLAASLAFYTLLSLAPLLIITIAALGLIFGAEAVRGEIAEQIEGLVGRQGGEAIQSMVASASHKGTGIFATIAGVVTLLIGATGVFTELQGSLDTIWDVAPKPGRGIWMTLKSRFLSMGMVLGIAFVLLVSLVVSAALAAMGGLMSGTFGSVEPILHAVNFVVSIGVISLLFAMIFKVLPDATVRWRDVWIGAGFTALLFTLGKFLIGLYLGKSSVASSYGAAGSVVIILLWVYYSAQILFFGAQFTQVYATHSGAPIKPTADAVSLSAGDKATQGVGPPPRPAHAR